MNVNVYDIPETKTWTAQEWIGKPIVSIENGEKIGSVSDFLIDPASFRVAGLVISKPSLLNRQAEIVPGNEVRSWGKDAIMVDRANVLVAPEQLQGNENWVSLNDQIRGKTVLSTSGEKIGQVEDGLIDQRGRLSEYVFGKLFHDGVLGGGKTLPLSATRSIGEDAIIVDLSQTGG